MDQPLRIFIGFDPRQPVSYQALHHSIVRRASVPVAITPLIIEQLPLQRTGLTPFTFSRFLVPYLCNFEGRGLFLDADMLVLHDIAELFALADDDDKAVWVVKNQVRFEWASMILFDCAHDANRVLTPEYVETADGLHAINWCDEQQIGDLPGEWNHLVLYDQPRDDAKLVHYTGGVPVFPETKGCEYTDEYMRELKTSMSVIPWSQLMGNSVHVKPVMEHLRRTGKLNAAAQG